MSHSSLPLALLLLVVPTAAQNRFAVSESYDPASFVGPGVTPSDVVVVNSSIFGGGGIQWDFAEMGLPASANIDGFSDGSDIFPASGPSVSPPPANCSLGGFIEAEFTVDPSSEGPPGGDIEEEATSDGAASDTFAARWDNGSSTASFGLASDALGVSPLPTQTDLDALTWLERRRYPVYFSVDPATATALGMDPASVYMSVGDGSPPTELFSSALLGLGPGDDIDALAVRAYFGPPATPYGKVVYSLSRTSPKVLAGGTLSDVTPAGLAVSTLAGGDVWAYPADIHTDPVLDNVNGVRITDPIAGALKDGSQISVIDGHPYPTIVVDNSSGNIGGYVDCFAGQPFNVGVFPMGGAADAWIVFVGIGVQNCSFPFQDPLMPTPMALHPGLSIDLAVGVGPLQVQTKSNQPLDLALQGIVVTGGGQVHTTNLVTARVR